MSKLKRSRALRRNLRKQARKGTLSAREQKTLLQQEKRFRKARRPLMKGLGFGAGLGAGAAAFLGAGGIAQALAQGLISRGEAKRMMEGQQEDQDDQQDDGRRPDIVGGAETMGPNRSTLEDYDGTGEGEEFANEIPVEVMEDELGRNPNSLFYDVEEQPSNQVVGGPGAVEDVVVVGEGEEAPAEERQPTAEDRARAELAAQRAERAREAGVDAALEAGLGGLDRPPVVVDDPPQPRERRRLPEVSQGVEVDMTPVGQAAAQRAQSRAERAREAAVDAALEAGLGGSESVLPGTLSERNMLDYLDNYGRPGPGRMSSRPANQIPMDRPDPRMGTVLDPRLPGAIDRARRSPLFMKQGGRVDKSNDLVARIKRKYGLR